MQAGQILYNLILLASLTVSKRLHNVGRVVFSRLLLLVRIWNIIQDPDFLFKPILSANIHLAQPYLSDLTETILGATS